MPEATSLPLEDCLRKSPERRKNSLKSFCYSLFMRRRRGMRRQVDHSLGHYVDIHDSPTVYTALTIVILSCADAFLTLILLQKGLAYEANPFMKMLIESNTGAFVATKTAITASCIIFLVAHKHFWLFRNRIRAHSVLFATLVAYASLINYEIILLNT